MKIRKTGMVMEVDIHGLRIEDAQYRLLHLLDHAGNEITEVVVIHGYRGGQALRDMILYSLAHPRIQIKMKTLNEGATRLILRKKKTPKS